MEEYWQLNWSRRVIRNLPQYESLYAHDIDANTTDIWNVHLNEINPVFLESSQHTNSSERSRPLVDPRTKKVVAKLEVNWTKAAFKKEIELYTDFPFSSKLSKTDHLTGIKAMRLAGKSNLTSIEEEIIVKYKSLLPTIQAEQLKFTAFEQDFYRSVHKGRIVLNQQAIDLGQTHLEKIDNHSMDDLYELQTAILLNNTEGLELVNWELVECTLRIGIAPRIKFESEKPLAQKVVFCPEKVKVVLNPEKEIGINFNAELNSLCKTNGGIVIPIELLTLWVNKEVDKEWITVLDIQEISPTKSFISFSKPVLKRNSSTKLESFDRGMRIGLLSQTLRIDKLSFRFEDSAYIVPDCPSKKGSNESDSEDEPMIIDDNPNGKEEPKQGNYKIHKIEDFLQSYVYRVEKTSPTNGILNKIRLTPVNQQDHSPIDVLISSVCDGVYHTHLAKDDLIYLSVKMEFKSEFGAQQMTHSELTREWLQLAFTAAKLVCRVRIDSKTNLLLAVRTISRTEIEGDLLRLYNMRPEMILGNVVRVIEIIQKFPAGEYVLSHDLGKSQIKVHSKTDEVSPNCKSLKELIDSDKMKSDAAMPEDPFEKVYQIPIDGTEITWLHKINSDLPGCVPVKKTVTMKGGFVQNDRAAVIGNYKSILEAKRTAQLQLRKAAKNRKKKLKKKVKSKM